MEFVESRALSRALGVDLASYDPELDDEPDVLPEGLTLLKSSRDYLPLTPWPALAGARGGGDAGTSAVAQGMFSLSLRRSRNDSPPEVAPSESLADSIG